MVKDNNLLIVVQLHVAQGQIVRTRTLFLYDFHFYYSVHHVQLIELVIYFLVDFDRLWKEPLF